MRFQQGKGKGNTANTPKEKELSFVGFENTTLSSLGRALYWLSCPGK